MSIESILFWVLAGSVLCLGGWGAAFVLEAWFWRCQDRKKGRIL